MFSHGLVGFCMLFLCFLQSVHMVLIVPLVGPSAFGLVFLWLSYGFPMVMYGFRMVIIFPLVGPSAFGLVFLWFYYGFVKLSYGSNCPPSLVRQLLDSFSYGFPIVV